MPYSRRVCEVILNGDKTFSIRQQKYKVSEALKTGEATVLFGPFFKRIGEQFTEYCADQ